MADRLAPSYSYAGLSVVVGLVSIAVGAGYWYWQWQRTKDHELSRDRDHDALSQLPTSQHPFQAFPSAQPISSRLPSQPPAQAMPVPPPSIAQVKQVQHWLNMIAGRKAGEAGAVKEDGSAGSETHKALASFQRAHGMTGSGKFDGMTLAVLKDEAMKASGTRWAPYQFKLSWRQGSVFGSLPGALTSHLPSSMSDVDSMLAGGHWVVEDSLGLHVEVPGRTDPHNPPAEGEITSLLVKHYGETSTVAQGIKAGRYEWACPDCATATLSRTSGMWPSSAAYPGFGGYDSGMFV